MGGTKATLCSGLWLAVISAVLANSGRASAMDEKERMELRLEAQDMFYHGYNAYMEKAWPADELMPLSCRGRFRGREPSRGDIDEALGNFSLTLIDSLDMLVVLGDLEEFESAVLKVVETVTFDTNVVVSVFETNIRIVGGLLSGHILAEYIREEGQGRMEWYRGQLLNMALDIATRLLPAFNSTTGLPYPRVNLKTGLEGVNTIQLTCTSCAGSIILEFAALSRLSGEKIFEEKASKAMDYLWAARHRQSNLVGNVLNVNTGDWVRRDSGVGAGIDSYYEYVAKAYVLLGEEKYLERWNTHYSAVMKYLGSGPLMMDVHMHRPTTNSKHFTDALGAFWPGLQVLMGDLKPAIEQHEVLYQIMKRHNFIPEAVTSDFQVHWGQHLLRPEFVESTYFLYKATRDPHYLQVGKKVLTSLQQHARVTCGYAAVKDVRTLQQEDRMDSFVLTETFKYLYLLFSEPEELYLDIDRFVFTTEAHLLPLSLARLSNSTAVPLTEEWGEEAEDEEVEFAMACPSTRYMFPNHEDTANAAASLRVPLGNIVEDSCPRQKVITRRLLAADFQSSNPQHIKLIQEMGISIVTMPDGRVQLLHTYASAESEESGEEGLYFMQEMIDLSKQQVSSASDSPPKQVRWLSGAGSDSEPVLVQAGPAQFGPELKNNFKVVGRLVLAGGPKACPGSLQNGEDMRGRIVLVERGDCMFVDKGRVIQSLGAIGGIVVDMADGSAAATSPLFAMSGDGTNDVTIPMVFLFNREAKMLIEAFSANPELEVTLEEKPEQTEADNLPRGPEDNGEAEEKLVRGLKSPVHEFMARGARELEIIQGRASVEEEEQDTTDSIAIHMNENTGEVVTEQIRTVRQPDGSSKTFKTIEIRKAEDLEKLVSSSSSVGEVKVMSIDMEEEEEEVGEVPTLLESEEGAQENASGDDLEDLETVMEDSSHSSSSSDSSSSRSSGSSSSSSSSSRSNIHNSLDHINSIADIFNPTSQKIQDLLHEVSVNSPEVLSEMIEIPFSQLLEGFQLLFLQSSSLEETYRTMFDRIKRLGGERFLEELKESGEEEEELIVTEKANKEEEIIAQVIKALRSRSRSSSSSSSSSSSGSSSSSSGISSSSSGGSLSDTQIGDIIRDYLAEVPSRERQNQVQVSALLELVLQATVESVMDSSAKSADTGDNSQP